MGYVDAHHTVFSTWFGRKMSNTFGVQFRSDWINNGLYRSENRVRTTKTDYSATGASFFPADSASASHMHHDPHLRITLAVTLPTRATTAHRLCHCSRHHLPHFARDHVAG